MRLFVVENQLLPGSGILLEPASGVCSGSPVVPVVFLSLLADSQILCKELFGAGELMLPRGGAAWGNGFLRALGLSPASEL